MGTDFREDIPITERRADDRQDDPAERARPWPSRYDTRWRRASLASAPRTRAPAGLSGDIKFRRWEVPISCCLKRRQHRPMVKQGMVVADIAIIDDEPDNSFRVRPV
jgi:hypothetical protein